MRAFHSIGKATGLNLLLVSFSLGQGSLTPPGSPAPSMKSLDQIEARSPISSVPVTINQSGSYYLTGNLKVALAATALTINADNVTLDLNGFTISSDASPATGSGIVIGADRHDITIRNGYITGTVTFDKGAFTGGGFVNGIAQANFNTRNVRVSEVSVSHVSGGAILLDDFPGNSIIESCQADTAGGDGLSACIVRRSTAISCGGNAVHGTTLAADCYGSSALSGYGVGGNTVANCFGLSKDGYGIEGGTVTNCRATSISNTGIYSDASVENSQGTSIDGDGIHAANTVLNSEGETRGSGTGLYAGYSATNCVGRTHDGIGLYAVNTGSGCFGDNDSSTKPGLKSDGVLSICTAQNFGTGPAMSTCIAIGCVTFGGPINASCSKQLGTP